MNNEYEDWIALNGPINAADALGSCYAVTQHMQKDFPELKRVRGHYHDAFWGPRTHWWLIAPDGSIVDPTKIQFPDQNGEYEPWTEGSKEPTGKCPNCGGYCYDGDSLCSDRCYKEYSTYLMEGLR